MIAREASRLPREAMASWCGLRPCRTCDLAARAAARASETGIIMASHELMPHAAAPTLAGGGIDAARLIDERPERAPRGDDQGEAGDLGVPGDGGLERAPQSDGAHALGDAESWRWRATSALLGSGHPVCALYVRLLLYVNPLCVKVCQFHTREVAENARESEEERR